jgi:hypothetical protein
MQPEKKLNKLQYALAWLAWLSAFLLLVHKGLQEHKLPEKDEYIK